MKRAALFALVPALAVVATTAAYCAKPHASPEAPSSTATSSTDKVSPEDRITLVQLQAQETIGQLQKQNLALQQQLVECRDALAKPEREQAAKTLQDRYKLGEGVSIQADGTIVRAPKK